MIETEGLVVEVAGDVAYIRAQRQSSCGGCAKQGESCGSATLLGFLALKTPLYQARNPLGTKAGDRVVIGVEDEMLFRGVLALYIPPLLLLVAGAIGGHLLAATPAAADGYAMLGALLGLAAGYFWARRYSARMANGGRYQAVVLNRVVEGKVVNFYGESHRKC